MFKLINYFAPYFSPYFSPEDKVGGAVEDKALSKGEMIDFMSSEDKEEVLDIKEKPIKEKEEDEKEEEEIEEKDDEKEEEKEDELTELEEELDGPEEDKLELVAPVRKKEILAAYPDLFKKFPYLERAYYREQKFTELLPTIKDAEMAVEKSNILDQFDADIRVGNLEKAISAVKGSGEEAFHNLVDNYLPNLYKIDKDAYLHVVGNLIKQTTHSMLAEAASSNNAELKEAAEIVNQFIFASKQVSQPTKLSREKPDSKAEDAQKQREQAYTRERFETSRDDLTAKVNNTIKSTIEANIDPKGSMSDYIKKNATRDCQERLVNMLDGDRRLTVIIDRLWDDSFKNNFSRASLDKIKVAYLSRAKALLPTVIKQARNEALKGSGKRVREESNEEEVTQTKRGPLPVGRTTSSNNGGGKSDSERAKAIPSNMTSKDYLLQD